MGVARWLWIASFQPPDISTSSVDGHRFEES
jgi:hypothetical protein